MASDTLSLQTLLAVQTMAEIQAAMETYAAQRGLPALVWTASSTPKVQIAAFAKILEDFYKTRILIASMGLLELATGDGLTLLAFNRYTLERNPAVFAQGAIVLEDIASAGPYTVTANKLWIEAENGFKFNNTTGGVLEKGGTLANGKALILYFKAEKSGAVYNAVPTGTSWLWVGNPMAGVRLSNPEFIPGSGSWLGTPGQDPESDSDLRDRCRNRLPTSGLGMTAIAWEYWTKKATIDITRVKVVSNLGSVAGLTGIIIAGADGELPPSTVETADEYLQPLKTTTTTLSVQSAVNVVIPISGVVHVDPNYIEQVTDYVFGSSEADIESVLQTYQTTVDIGGIVYKSQIVALLQDILKDQGAVKYVTISSPTEEMMQLGDEEIAFFDFSVDSIEVTSD